MVKDRRRAAVGGVCGFVVCCAVSDTTPLLLVGVVVLGVLQQGALGVVWGLWGVVDVGDEFVLVLTITAAHVRFLCVAWTL